MLTDQQLVDTRRYMGYPMLGDTKADDNSDMAYGWVSPGTWQTLAHRLKTLRPEEETIVINFLTTLSTLEAAIPASGDNLDTDQAAVWYHNKNEVRDRTKLYSQWRRQLCNFVGIAPGPGLGDDIVRVVRG